MIFWGNVRVGCFDVEGCSSTVAGLGEIFSFFVCREFLLLVAVLYTFSVLYFVFSFHW